MSARVNPFDLKRQLAFYGAYHTNPTNIAIHIIGVPSIIFSVSLFLSTYPSVFTTIQAYAPTFAAYLSLSGSKVAAVLPASAWAHASLTPAAIFMSSYMLYYITLDPVAAMMLLPLWYGIYHHSAYLADVHPTPAKLAGIIHAAGWIFQFYGHGVHEGRAPALLDNLLGAVVLAPFFVFIEVAFLFGYRPELQKYLKNETGRLVAEFRRNKAKAKRT